MAFVRCFYSGDESLKDDILKALSSATAEGIGKPEATVMVQVDYTSSLMFRGSKQPCAMIHIEAVGGSLEDMVDPITDILTSIGGVLQDRVYINFQSYDTQNWGANGITVAKFQESHHK
jgi:phenylpyruvate tautomerase